jgi:hypothetical protein
VTEDHTHVVNNGKRDLTIDELARMQPGMDRLMAEVGPRLHRCYHAALAGNWPLAAYFSKSAVKQLALSAESRPKYEPEMTAYLRGDYAPVTAGPGGLPGGLAGHGGPGQRAARLLRQALHRVEDPGGAAGRPRPDGRPVLS